MDMAKKQESVDEERRKIELVQEAIHEIMEKRKRQTEKNGLMVQQEEDDLLSTLLSKLDALEKDADTSQAVPNHKAEEGGGTSTELEVAEIAKDLNKIKRQNVFTHCLLGAVIVLTAFWQFNEVSFLIEVRKILSNPLRSVGELIKGSLRGRGKKPLIEAAPLPPVAIPDISRTDLPMLVLNKDDDEDD